MWRAKIGHLGQKAVCVDGLAVAVIYGNVTTTLETRNLEGGLMDISIEGNLLPTGA